MPEKRKRSKGDIAHGTFIQNSYIYIDDSWKSRGTRHMTCIRVWLAWISRQLKSFVSKPKISMMSQLQILSSILHELLASSTKTRFLPRHQQYGYIFSAHLQVVICIDSAGANTPAGKILPIGHLDITIIQCSAHISALQSVKLLRFSPHAHVISNCLHSVSYLNEYVSRGYPCVKMQ